MFPLTCCYSYCSRLDLQEAGVNSSAAFEYGYPIGSWNVSQIVDFSFAFSQQESFNEDISFWDTSNARNFSFMFEGAQAFNQPIGEWIVSRVTSAIGTFHPSQIWQGYSKERRHLTPPSGGGIQQRW